MIERNLLETINRLENEIRTLKENQQIRGLTIPDDGYFICPSYASDPAGGDSTAGQIYFNTTTNKHKGYDGSTWNNLY